jgi:hypothetical protein
VVKNSGRDRSWPVPGAMCTSTVRQGAEAVAEACFDARDITRDASWTFLLVQAPSAKVLKERADSP